VERRDPPVRNACDTMGGRGAMPKTPVHLHDLRRRRDAQAKAAPSWRFWGLSGPSCTPDTRQEASQLAKANNGAPGMDGVTFAAIAASGVDELLEPRRPALVTRTSRPRRVRHQAMPKNGGQGGRVLSRPTIRARVVPGAGKRIREPLCAADFQPGSYGYRPKRSAHDAIGRVAEAMVQDKTRVIAVDVHASCDTSRPPLLVAQVAQRVNDPNVRPGLKLRLKASGTKGVAPGGVLSPFRSHRDRPAVDRRLERATEVPRRGPSTSLD